MRYHRPFSAQWATSAIRVLALKLRFGRRIEIGFDSSVGPRCRIAVCPGGLLRLRSTNVTRDVTVDVSQDAVIEVGPDGWLGPGSFVAAQRRVVLGAGSKIAEYVTIRDHDHVHDAEHVMDDWCYTSAPVVIGADVWVGAKATIVAGVSIGDHAVIAANAVVTHDVGHRARVGGTPARPLPDRGPAAEMPAAAAPGAPVPGTGRPAAGRPAAEI